MARKAQSSANASNPVGTETLSYCTSCKMDLGHVVVALKGDRIAKVQCKTCKKEHGFRAPKGITEPRKKAAKKGKKKDDGNTTVHVEVEWERLMSQNKELPMKPYGAKKAFILGDKIRHDSFGDGIVNRLIYPNKIEVIFRLDMKVLIHAGQPTLATLHS